MILTEKLLKNFDAPFLLRRESNIITL